VTPAGGPEPAGGPGAAVGRGAAAGPGSAAGLPDGVVLSVQDMNVVYHGQRPVWAVRDVSLELHRGEVLGLAGESGCGKSTLAYAMTRLLRPPAELASGRVLFHDSGPDGDGSTVDVMALVGEQLRRFRWRKIATVPQGAMNALNPVLTVHRQLADTLGAHLPEMSRAERAERSAELLELVGIDRSRLRAYPHQLSGGMRQRVMIAMALALRPDVVVLDEPTTALDVVVQRDILREIDRLREQFGFAVVFITHDLSLLLEISDRIAVMYAGRLVEYGSAARIGTQPAHPYTAGLLNCFPSLRGERRNLRGIPGSPPDLAAPLVQCGFADRCPHVFADCRQVIPPLYPVTDRTDSAAACLLHDRRRNPGGLPEALRHGEFAVEQLPVQERA
jgi:peptide/nickel transport system ATP-binding protein